MACPGHLLICLSLVQVLSKSLFDKVLGKTILKTNKVEIFPLPDVRTYTKLGAKTRQYLHKPKCRAHWTNRLIEPEQE